MKAYLTDIRTFQDSAQDAQGRMFEFTNYEIKLQVPIPFAGDNYIQMQGPSCVQVALKIFELEDGGLLEAAKYKCELIV